MSPETHAMLPVLPSLDMPDTPARPQPLPALGHSFVDRRDAGRQLAQRLGAYAHRDDVIVLALPRGGVPVAAEIARALDAPLDILVVRKLGLPGQPEYAMGAIASGDVRVLNTQVIQQLAISYSAIDIVTRAELRELHRREKLYRGDRPMPLVAGRQVVLVDDGMATGASMRAAVHALRELAPARIVVAVPVSAAETCHLLGQDADEVICGQTPERFRSVGQWYERFEQTTDEEVRRLLTAASEVAAAVRT
jgi:predicted phosphoribosyltransferase